MKTVRCESEITGVVVHSRGAVITRRVELSGEKSAELEVLVEGITGRVQEGTIRVGVGESQARLVAVRSRVELAEADAEAGPTTKQVEILSAQLADKREERDERTARLSRWNQLQIAPRGLRALKEQGPLVRTTRALELVVLARQERERLAGQILGLEEEIEELNRRLRQVYLEDQQASDQDRRGETASRLVFVIHLADVGEQEELELSYVVDDARWWPTYSVNLDSVDKRVRLDVEAVGAQGSGEDWPGVELALSTAELNMDAQLPKLPSQRLGRRQAPAPPSGYRPPPEGLESLFGGYDAAHSRLVRPEAYGHTDGQPQKERYAPKRAPRQESALSEQSAPIRASSGGMPPPDISFGGAMPPAPSGAPPSAPVGASMLKKRSAPARSRAQVGQAQAEAPAEIEPGDGWLNFDRLRLGAPSSSYRGKLHRVSDDHAHLGGTTRPLASNVGQGMVDPVASRGSFDYRYDGEGRFRIPADGKGHRVQLRSVEGPCQWRWRCVPRVEPAVYREVHFTNPLDAALLDGPARVFIDGEYRSQAQLHRVDRGGKIQLGLGVEERIQVIRNARFGEEGAGLLGGKRSLDHEVDIELRSSLGIPVEVEVVDRLPVTDDESVAVKMLSEHPTSEPYDQSERRGQTLRGGRLWRVPLTPGGQGTVKYTYLVQIRTRDELIGGNRRE